MTKKITIAALTEQFGRKAEQIATLCMRAPNPQFEIETLLGVFEMPNVPKSALGRDCIYELVSYTPSNEPSSTVKYSKKETVTRWFRDENQFESRSKNYTGAGESRESTGYPLQKTFTCVNGSNTSLEWWLEQTPVIENH